MHSIWSKLRLRAVGTALLAFAVLLLAAPAPSAASTYTLTYSGTVTSATGMFAGLGVGVGDVVNGSVDFSNIDFYSDNSTPPNVFNHAFYQFPMSSKFTVDHSGAKYSFDVPGLGSIISQLLGGSSSTLALTANGPVTRLTLFYETLTANPPLETLAGLTDWGQVPALLTGATANFFGKYEVTDLGSVFFSINLAPTPAVATTPIPAALPLFVSALGGIGFFGWRRRAKPAA
jgi:hypothetical protein